MSKIKLYVKDLKGDTKYFEWLIKNYDVIFDAYKKIQQLNNKEEKVIAPSLVRKNKIKKGILSFFHNSELKKLNNKIAKSNKDLEKK